MIAWVNSWVFATPPLASPRNDLWGKFPTQHDQSEALATHISSAWFLRWFVRRREMSTVFSGYAWLRNSLIVIPVLTVTAILLPSTMDQKLWLIRSRKSKIIDFRFLCSLGHVKHRCENVKLLRLREILLSAKAIRAAGQKDCESGDGIALLLYTDLPQWQGWLVYPEHLELASNLHFARFSFVSFQAFQLLSPQQDCTSSPR